MIARMGTSVAALVFIQMYIESNGRTGPLPSCLNDDVGFRLARWSRVLARVGRGR